MKQNELYLRKKLKVLVANKNEIIPEDSRTNVITILKNIEPLGYSFSRKLFNRLLTFKKSQLSTFYKELYLILQEMKGDYGAEVMYPNFPQQVADASEVELYLNAYVHYLSFQLQDAGVIEETWLPKYKKEKRSKLTESIKLDVIDLGSEEDFFNIFVSLISSKSSISISDKEIVKWFVSTYKESLIQYLPEEISNKEQLALLCGLFLEYTTKSRYLVKYIKTPTDVLRIITAFSDGDISLAENTKFKKLKRSERKFFLALLEYCNTDLAEEMVKYRHQWIRIGEIIHPGEYNREFPRSNKAFNLLRNSKIETYNGKVEQSIKTIYSKIDELLKLLHQRPGIFARRLDHLFRISNKKDQLKISNSFFEVIDKISTPVLLQVYSHFKIRSENINSRTVFPKGQLAKIRVIEQKLPKIDEKFCIQFSQLIWNELYNRFSKLETLGKVYIDSKLKNYIVPFSQRSASKALKTITRGSKIDLDGDYDTIRFFVYWKNGDSRTDIDLSSTLLDENFIYKDTISYYNLKSYAGCHSGDITDAPNGASEFIDISMRSVIDSGARYIAMTLNSFTNQPYCDLPDCFAGWMGRQKPNSGEIYEPKTVKNKIDLTANAKIAIPLLIDCLERKVIWMDLSLKNTPDFDNNVHNNKNNISLLCKAMTNLNKLDMYDLFMIHAEARGKIVKNINKADTIFSEEKGITPFDIDKISSEFL
jgi:hypothetical protein